jgi:hypothetical protein
MPQINFFATLAFSCCSGFLSAYLAFRRGRDPYVWFFIGVFFGFLGILALFFAPSKQRRKKNLPVEMPTFEEIIIGPSDKFWYYLDAAHKQKGPMSFSALNKAWKQGTITTQTFVWQEEFSDWKPLQECIQRRKISPRI